MATPLIQPDFSCWPVGDQINNVPLYFFVRLFWSATVWELNAIRSCNFHPELLKVILFIGGPISGGKTLIGILW